VPNQQSAYFPVAFVTSYTELTLLNIVPRSHALVRTEINFLCRSFDRPTTEESFSNMRTQKVEKSRNLVRIIKEKENEHEPRFYFLPEYPRQISRFLGFVGPILLKLSSMVAYRTSKTESLFQYARVHEIWVQDLAKLHFLQFTIYSQQN